MAMCKRMAILCIFTAALAAPASAGVCDGRLFSLRMLGDQNGNAKVDLDEIGNGMTVGNGPAVAYKAFLRGCAMGRAKQALG